ncbi:MAG: DUF3341 domain-containing protein [Planctomycetota bacterium]
MSILPASIGKALSAYAPFIKAPPPRFRTEEGKGVYGMLAEFPDTPTVYHAAEIVRDAGYARWDVYAPFPIHGIDEAMGHKRTKLPMMVAAGGFTGAGLGYLMQFWISGVDYQMMKQGKPFAAWEAFVPIIFELGVLFAAFTALLGMLALNGLPRWHHPLMSKRSFLKTSDDRFMICVETDDPAFDPDATRELLEKAGATSIELVEDDE